MKCFLTILLFALVSCATPSSSEDGIKISIDVHELPSIGLAISTTDYDIQLVNFDSNKHGEYVINNMDAAYITLHNGFSERKRIYAEQGDHIHLTFDGKSMKESLEITGDHPRITEYLSRQKTIPYNRNIYSLQFPEFESALKEKIIENYLLLDSCKNTLKNESEKFIKLERARIKYSFAPALLNYPKVHGGKDLEKIRDDYYTTIKNWIEEDKDYLNLNEYRTFVALACATLASQEGKNTTTYYEKILEQMYYLDQNFKQKDVKQGFISLWANEYVQNNGIKQIDELNKFTREKLTDNKLLARYTQIYDSWARIAPGNKAIDFHAQDSTGKEFSLKDFKNQYVCLYIWQNVYPCMVEFSHLKKLIPLLEEKNIQLINLSIEPKPDEWKKAIRNQDIQIGKHFFLKNEKEFLKNYHYNSETMYQFILITPDGKIVESHLPKASSGKLEKYLTEQI